MPPNPRISEPSFRWLGGQAGGDPPYFLVLLFMMLCGPIPSCKVRGDLFDLFEGCQGSPMLLEPCKGVRTTVSSTEVTLAENPVDLATRLGGACAFPRS